MSDHNLQKPLQSLSPMLYHVIAESVCKDLTGQRRNRHSGTFSLQDVTKIFEVRIATADSAVFELEGRNIGSADNLVISIHVTGCAVSLRVFNLDHRRALAGTCTCLTDEGKAYLPLSLGSSLEARRSPRKIVDVHLAWLA